MTDTSIEPPFRAAPLVLDKLAAALSKAQAEMTGASKDANNPHFQSKYADLASVWNAIREPLTKNGLAVVQLLRSVQGGIEVETILLHTSGQQISEVFGVPASKNDAQGYGSAATYARRYSLMAMVGVAPEDDDGNAAAAGAPGSAGGGTQFRPERRTVAAATNGLKAAREDIASGAQPVGTPRATTPPAGNAIKRIEWVKASIAAIKVLDKQGLTDWWAENKERIDVIETALPTEYERLLVAYDGAIEAAAGMGRAT